MRNATLLKEKREKFTKAMSDAETIRLQYDGKPDTNMSDEELARYDGFLNEAFGLKAEIERMEKEDILSDWSSQVKEQFQHGGGRVFGKTEDEVREQKYFAAYKEYLKGQPGQSQKYGYMETPEFRAYQADNPSGGGFLVTPQILAGQILTLMKDLVFMRGLSYTMTVSTAESLGLPAIDVDPSDSDWTSELAVGNEEATMSTGKREFKPNPLAKYIKLSKKLLRLVSGAESVVLDRLTYKMSIAEEKAFLTGDGAQKPLGVFTADSNGISTGRDVTAANATSIVSDDLLNVIFSLKAQYRSRASWIINRTVLKAARKLKDNNNNYIWSTGIAPGLGFNGTPATLMGYQYAESEYAPGTITSGLYTAIFGDFSKYWIVDALDMQIQVLYELFALSNQMGYILRKETDGMPVLEEAFARLKQA